MAKQPIRTAAVILLLLVLAGGHVPGAAWSAAGQPPSVLVLNSYHQGYEWSDNEIEGVLEGLRTAYPDIVPAIEHLDLKRFPAEDHQARLSWFLSGKYRSVGVDIVIALDNPAFEILLKHRDEILPGIPVVFAGVNDFSPEMVSGRSGITGIAEVQDHAGTLALALRLHPGTRRVLAVHDYTASGLAVRREMEAALPAFRDRVQIDFNGPASYEEMARQIAELRPGELALILSFATDRTGRSLTPEQSTLALTAGARVPVYAMHETRLGHGIVGGMLVGGVEHGRRAAAVALRVLAGEDPSSIPVETAGCAGPMFDHVQLQRFDIAPDALPPGSILANRPAPFYETHKVILLAASAVVSVLLALIACLLATIRHRMRAEAALRESEARFRVLYEKAPLPYQSLDANGNFIAVNQAFLAVLGYSLEEVIGRNFGEFLAPEWGDHFKQNFPQFKAVGEILGIEFEMVKKDRSRVLVSFNGKIAIDRNGRFQQTHCIFTDITERRQAEIDLQAQRDMLEAIFESSPFVMMLVDEDLRVRRINRVGAAFAGRSNEEVLGRLCGDALRCVNAIIGEGCGCNTVCAGCQVRCQAERTLRTGEAVLNALGKFVVAAGQGESVLHMLVSTAQVKAAGREFVLVSMADITERVRAESALRDSEERHRRIVESSSDAILLRSGETIIYANPAALRLFRANHPRELVGKRYLELVHPDDRALSAERVKRNVDEHWVASPREHRVMALDGQTVHVESTGVPVHYKGETQIFGVFRDITERRKAEQEKESLEAQLRQAQKMEALGTLAGGIAHDFNNILSVIIGNSEILDLADAVSPSARDSLAQITAAAQRAKQLVKQILAFSRHARQEKMVINLKPIVKETIDFLRASLPATIQVKHYLDPGAGQILADPTQMQQVLMNLCTNAGHAMEKDGGTLEITLGNVARGGEDDRLRPMAGCGEHVRLSVSDTGHGIDPAVLPHIFEPYFTTKGPGKGTGLGLSVVHGIVTSHDGTIRVDSEPGRGTVFHVYFPLADRPVTPEAAENQPLPRGSGRILFVDDEPELADLGSRMLRSLGYEVESRTSPIEALEAFRADPGRFELVITDLTMPNMTGLKLAGHLIEIRPGTPVVLCTGFSDHANEQRARELGVRAFLFKPLLMRDLALAVRKASDEPPAGGSDPNPA